MKKRGLMITFMTAALVIGLLGCEDPDNCLEGSLGSVYDLSFNDVQAREFRQSKQLAIEYVRGQGTGEEKPILLTLMPTPDGPGAFSYADGEVGIDNSVVSGALLPDLTSAEVDLDAFTPNEAGTNVQGSVHARFTNAGNTYSLEACFKAPLVIVP